MPTISRAAAPSAAPMSIHMVVELVALLLVVVVHQVGRLLADRADDRAVLRQDADALGDQHRRRPAADGGEPEVPVVVDVDDHEADLIDVAEDPDDRAALRGWRRQSSSPSGRS